MNDLLQIPTHMRAAILRKCGKPLSIEDGIEIPKLKSGGLLISDNVLWSGKVISSSMDKETNILKKYNKLVNKDKRMESVLLPIRDGITLSIKV